MGKITGVQGDQIVWIWEFDNSNLIDKKVCVALFFKINRIQETKVNCHLLFSRYSKFFEILIKCENEEEQLLCPFCVECSSEDNF